MARVRRQRWVLSKTRPIIHDSMVWESHYRWLFSDYARMLNEAEL